MRFGEPWQTPVCEIESIHKIFNHCSLTLQVGTSKVLHSSEFGSGTRAHPQQMRCALFYLQLNLFYLERSEICQSSQCLSFCRSFSLLVLMRSHSFRLSPAILEPIHVYAGLPQSTLLDHVLMLSQT